MERPDYAGAQRQVEYVEREIVRLRSLISGLYGVEAWDYACALRADSREFRAFDLASDLEDAMSAARQAAAVLNSVLSALAEGVRDGSL